jgi:hypothetical protein
VILVVAILLIIMDKMWRRLPAGSRALGMPQ